MTDLKKVNIRNKIQHSIDEEKILKITDNMFKLGYALTGIEKDLIIFSNGTNININVEIKRC